MTRRFGSLVVGTWLFGCGEAVAPSIEEVPRPPPPEVETPAEPTPPAVPPRPAHLTVLHPRELAGIDLDAVESLDLALSTEDRHERASELRDDLAYEQGCAELDLIRLAERAPALTQLRLSGCLAAAHAGLDALVGLTALELADLTLDSVLMGRIVGLPRLHTLTLTRVVAGTEPVSLLGRARLTTLVLRDLEPDSGLAAIAGQVAGLRTLALEGSWAGHEAMLEVARATGLQEVRLVDTRVGNFSLHQLKPLAGLRRLDWRGSTFNEHSLLYVRDLPLEEFTCMCPGLGDSGLRTLGRQVRLRRLALTQSRITGPGLTALSKLTELEALEIRRRDLGPEGLAALASLPKLTALVLGLPTGTPLADPALTHLGELAGLRSLVLDIPALDDRAAGELAALTGLVELDLGGTQISDLGLKALAEMHALRMLKLHHTRVTNRGLAHLAKLSRLEVLELDHTDLVDAGVAHLKGLTELRSLRLDATLITDQALAHLLAMHRLEQINLADTVVTAEGAAQLARLPALRAVNLARTRGERRE